MIERHLVVLSKDRRRRSKALVRIHVPESTGAGTFSCQYEIVGLGRRVCRTILGIDALQAFELALKVVDADISMTKQFTEGRLYFLRPGDGWGFPSSTAYEREPTR